MFAFVQRCRALKKEARSLAHIFNCLLLLGGDDLRERLLVKRKRLLRSIVPKKPALRRITEIRIVPGSAR